MIYLDTSIIISYVDDLDPNHELAEQLIQKYRDRFIVSYITLIELASVYSRAGYENPQAHAYYTIETVDAEVVEVDYKYLLNEAFRMSSMVRLRTLDLLHLAAAKTIGADKILTLDKDIIRKAELINQLNLKILPTKK